MAKTALKRASVIEVCDEVVVGVSMDYIGFVLNSFYRLGKIYSM